MEPLLQPLRTTQLLDRAVYVFRRHFLFFVLLCLPAVVVVVGTGELGRRAFSVIYRERSIQIFFSWIFQIVAYATAVGTTAALVVFGLRGIESGQPYTVIGCYRAARAQWPRIAGIQSLVALRLIGVFLVTAVAPTLVLAIAIRHYPPLFARFFAWRAVIGVTVLLLIVTSMIWMVHSFARHSLAAACCVVENTGIRASLKRSRKLANGAKGRIWTMFFFALCLFIPIASLAELPSALAEQWVSHHKALFEGWTLLASMFAMAISAPIVVIGTTLVYYDQRIRREALDVQTLIEAAEAHNAAQVSELVVSPEVAIVNAAPVVTAVSAERDENEDVEKIDETPGAASAAAGS